MALILEKCFGELPSLKLTASLHLKMDGWNTSFLLERLIFRGELLVSLSVIFHLMNRTVELFYSTFGNVVALI